ncbi:MAG: EamA family transporter [Microbacteriaceae bacterium]|nr:EamA family transporter [Cryobacterium sp.]MBX3104417.1 EamA family transporter [Cryobacterium sp.]MCC6376816.1 EamA family transporter [Microbacteriaceae bacterium]
MGQRSAGATSLIAAELSIGFGSSLAGILIPIVGSVVVVAARQLVTVLILLPTVRPRLTGKSFKSLLPVIGLGVVLATMNLSFYESLGRIGLGLAVTIEFFGPLSIALLTSRRFLDFLCVAAVGLGVYLLADGEKHLDLIGVILAIVAGASWACYILLAKTVARRFKGLEGLSMASVISLAILAPAALALIDWSQLNWWVIGLLLATGILCSAIPYSLDAFILRRITARLYSIILSTAPAIAALFGWLVLGQQLTWLQVFAVILVTLAAAITFATQKDEGPSSELEGAATVTP